MENEDKTDSEEEPTPKEELKDTVDRLEKANEEKARLLQEEQELAAKNLLGGQSQQPPAPEPPKEPSDKEYAEGLLSGEVKYQR